MRKCHDVHSSKYIVFSQNIFSTIELSQISNKRIINYLSHLMLRFLAIQLFTFLLVHTCLCSMEKSVTELSAFRKNEQLN